MPGVCLILGCCLPADHAADPFTLCCMVEGVARDREPPAKYKFNYSCAPFLLPFLLRLWAIQTSILRIGDARARGAAAPRNKVTGNALSSLTRDFSIVSMTEMGRLAGLL